MDFKATCPTIQAFVDRFREQPAMKPSCVKPECNSAHLEHWLTFEPGVKAQLSIDYLTALDAKN